ncbi:MAG: HAD family hydrolase [Planctomycetota bacterium]|nr:HAD family hydrolase [Planctomycetota bacterium]
MSAPTDPRRAIFLDRDGTLIHDPGYLGDPAGVALLPDVADGLRALVAAGLIPVIVTNQSGIARGRYTPEDYARVEARVFEVLGAEGIDVLATYYCPYHPEGTVPAFTREHEDRKPGPGMWLRAAADHGLDLPGSWSIGDGERDIVAAKRAGSRAVLLAGGRDKWPMPVEGPYDADFVARDFREAVLFILRAEGRALPAAPGAALAPGPHA